MPATRGWATRSSASRPRRRRTKAPRLSSGSPPRGSTRSQAIRSLPGQEKSREASRRQQLKALGQRMQAAAPDHKRAPEAIVGTDQPILQPDPLAQGEGPRLLGQERVGPALDEKAVTLLGLDGAAHPVRALEHGQLERPPLLPRPLPRAVGRGQPGDPRADDDEPHRSVTRSTRSASMAMKSGWSLAAGARWNATPTASAARRASTSRS